MQKIARGAIEIVETVDKVLNEKLAAETTESFTNTTAKKRGAKLLNTKVGFGTYNAMVRAIDRVLSKKGKFYISVPDMDVLCKIFLDSKAPPQVKLHVLRMMFGGQVDEYDFHYTGWNFQFMNHFLLKAGFDKIERVKSFSLFKDTSDYAPYGVPISLNVIAHK